MASEASGGEEMAAAAAAPAPAERPASRVTRRQVRQRERQQKKEMDKAARKYVRGGTSAQVEPDPNMPGRLRSQVHRATRWKVAAARSAARAELVHNTEQQGFLEAEKGEHTSDYRQRDIRQHLDAQTKRKTFQLSLPQLGPYVHDYSFNGNMLCLAGEKGHAAVFEWKKKKLFAEVQLKDRVSDVHFLHDDRLFAAAQRKYVYIYDNRGQEVHLLHNLQGILRLDFLRQHFLLTAVGRTGLLFYFDVSTGVEVAAQKTKLGPCSVMRQNPWNAVIGLGHSRGQVTMWSPKCSAPLAKMLCHKAALTDLLFTADGRYLATAGMDSCVRVWDMRTFKQLGVHLTHGNVNSMDVSQNGLLAWSTGGAVQVHRNWMSQFPAMFKANRPYLQHDRGDGGEIKRCRFAVHEDILGLGLQGGFSSIVVPGAGEANYDYYVANPYESAKQRRERPVHQLLNKLAPDLICLDPTKIGQVDSRDKRQLKTLAERQQKFNWNQSMTGVHEEDAGSDEAKEEQAEKTIVRPERRRPKRLKEKRLYLQKQEHSAFKAKRAAKRSREEAAAAAAGEGAGGDGAEKQAKRARVVSVGAGGERKAEDPLGDFFASKERAKRAAKVGKSI